MKYIMIVCGGMSDRAFSGTDQRTPMSTARKPAADLLASKSEVGIVRTIGSGIKPDSCAAALSVLGYHPSQYYTGRSPFETAGAGLEIAKTDVSLCCSLVTLSDDEEYTRKTMLGSTVDGLTPGESTELISCLQEQLGNSIFRFRALSGGTNTLIWTKGEPSPGILTPPREAEGNPIEAYLPRGEFTRPLSRLMEQSYTILSRHPVNRKRIAEGKAPANAVWLWGEGTKPQLPAFQDKYGLHAALISLSPIHKGIARAAGMAVPSFRAADTPAEGLTKMASVAVSELLSKRDLVYIHCEAPAHYGYQKNADGKAESIALIDEMLIAPILRAMSDSQQDYSLLLLSDRCIPLSLGTDSGDPVPFLIYRSNAELDSGITVFNEASAESTDIYIDPGYFLIDRFLQNE